MKRIKFIFVFLIILAIALVSTPVFSNPGSGSSSGRSSTGSRSNRKPQELALTYYKAGLDSVESEDFDRAIIQFKKALSARRNYAEASNMLGFSYRKLGHYQESLLHYKKALKLQPNFAEAHEYIGETYLALKDLKESLKHYIILKKLGSDEAKELWEKIEAYVTGSR